MPKLVYQDSDGVEKTLSLGADPVLIGRATECQVQTQDAMVSRRHARIEWDGSYWIEDLGSSNGVFVGSERVQRAPLRPGDTVTCGSLVLRMLPDPVRPRPTGEWRAQDLRPDPPARARPREGLARAAVPTLESPAQSDAPLRDPGTDQVTRPKSRTAPRMAAVSSDAVVLAPGSSDVSAQPQPSEDLRREREGRERAEAQLVAVQRKLEQAQADLRRLRAGLPEDTRDEQERLARAAAEQERDDLRGRLSALENLRIAEAARLSQITETLKQTERERDVARRQVIETRGLLAVDRSAPPAAVDPALAEAAIAVSDALAELKASLRAASDEAATLQGPDESALLISEALHEVEERLELARAHARSLARLLDPG